MPDRLPIARERPWWQGYGAAVLAVAAAAAIVAAAPVLAEDAFVVFFAAVAAAGAYRGLGPALFAVVLSSLVVSARFLEPTGTLALDTADAVRVGVFLATGSLMGVLTDMRLRETRRERARREWADVTLASIGDAVMVTDAEGGILFMNGVAEKLCGCTLADARGEPIPDVFRIVNEHSRAPVQDPVTRVRREGRVVGLANHTVLLARNGREVPIDDSGAPIWSEDGRLAGAVLVFRDISDRKQADAERTALLERETRARAQAEAANRAKDEFLATLSHELRTPLHAILGWTQVLRDGTPATDELAHGLGVIERNVRRQTRLIDDVLDISRIVAGTLRLELEQVAVGPVVEAALEVVRPAAQAKQLAVELRGDADAAVLGDAERLQQVVWNLLSNAVKFTPPNGRIEVRLAATPEHVEIRIVDSGEGIDPSFLPHVFDRFRQAESGSRRPHSGLGLGLAIVRHLVEMHGGSVEATSRGLGHGSTFLVRLPAAVGDAQAPASPRASRTGSEVPDLGGLRVLCVDDEADARELVAAMLTSAGAEVRTASSAAEALALASAWEPDVLVSDLEMPGEDGYDLLRRMRERREDLPAVALTAYASADDRLRALRSGFQLHLPKPVGRDELQLVVASAARWRPPRAKA